MRELPDWWPSDKPYIMGDCLEGMRTLPADSIDLIIADPPYNIGKAEWDKIDDYYYWCIDWILECQRILKANGSLYIFHNNMPTISKLMVLIEESTEFIFRSLITWEKYQTNKQYYGRNVIMGVNNSEKRNYYPMSEYILFYTFSDLTGAEQLSDTYQRINPMAKYLQSEFKRSGVRQKELRALFPSKTGGETGCVTNWIKGYNFPLKKQYETMRKYINDQYGTEYLRKEYEELRKEYEELRYTFNFVREDITRTWLYPPSEKKGHVTPKSLEVIQDILLHSSKANDIILSPFLGSGTDILAGRITERTVLGYEIGKVFEKELREKSLLNIPELEAYGGLDQFTTLTEAPQ